MSQTKSPRTPGDTASPETGHALFCANPSLHPSAHWEPWTRAQAGTSAHRRHGPEGLLGSGSSRQACDSPRTFSPVYHVPLIWKRRWVCKKKASAAVSEHRALYPRSKRVSGWSEPHVTSDSPTCSFHCRQNLGSQSLKILQGTRDKYSRPWAPPSASRILHCGQKRRRSPDSPEMDTSKASHRNAPMGVKDARPCLKEDTAWARTGPEPGHRVSPLPP